MTPKSSGTDMPFHCLLLLVVCVFLPAAAFAAGQPGRTDYDYYCYQCHGYAGDARTTASRYLSPPPRDFTRARPDQLDRSAMVKAVRNGKPGTAMMPFSRVLSPQRIEAIVDYVRAELLGRAAKPLRYHTEANGWRDHERYRAAFPFAQGTLSLALPWESLTPVQREGKRMFLSACSSCHDGDPSGDGETVWEPRAVSFPRSFDTCLDCHASRPAELLPLSRAAKHVLPATFAHGSATDSPYPVHRKFDNRTDLGDAGERGQAIFLANCAYCHAADGSSRNWIGSFLQPHPRDLQAWLPRGGADPDRLRTVVREGIPGTSMPGWKSVLTDAQIDDIIAYLRRGFGNAAQPGSVAAPAGLARPALHWVRSAPVR